MKKQLLTAVAIMVSAFFAGTMIAQAASVEIGGQLRPRFEYNEQSNFNNLDIGGEGVRQPDGDYFVSTRIRLHAKADILPDTSAFIQLQSVRNFGNDLEGISGGVNVPGDCAGPGLGCTSGGSGNAAFTPSDNDNTVGVHQAYFTL
ncbi:MAG: hypothetical protein ACE5GQ_11685, partial [Nitrospinales bacterium]